MKKKYWLLFIFTLFIFLNRVYADEATGGHSGSDSACDSRWCWTSVGVRISLYRYDGVDLKYFGSNDYNAYRRDISNHNVKTTTKMAGKVAYQKLSGYTVSLGSSKTVSSSKTFSCFYGTKNDAGALCNSFTITTNGEIKNYLYFNKTDGNTIISRINSLFTSASLSMGDSKNIYITVEPTMVIYKGSNYYYGTSYELLKLLSLGSIGSDGLNEVLKMKLPSSIMAQTIYGKDTNNFVSYGSSSPVGIVSGSLANDNYSSWINTNKGYGIAVYWLGSFVKDTCSAVCGSNISTDCAETYCENIDKVKNYTGTIADGNKKTCMTGSRSSGYCGLSEPSKLTCSNYSPGPTNTTCSDSVSSTKNTCTSETDGTYYMIQCEETTNLKYSDDLPITFYTKTGGFNFSIVTSGNKKCTFTFNKNRWEFNFKTLKRENRNTSVLLSKLTNFNATGLNVSRYNYKFDSSDDSFSLKVKSSEFKFNQTINDNPTPSEPIVTNAYYYTTEGTVGHPVSKQVGSHSYPKTITYETENYSLFELPKQCYSLSKGILNPTKSDGSCDDTDIRNIAYYGFYSTYKDSRIETKIISKKDSSGLNDTNICYYENKDPNDNVYCSVEVKYSGSTATLKYSVTNRNNKAISCYFDNNNVVCPTITPITKTVATSSKRNINSYITYTESGKTIKKDCSVTINSGKTGENCTVKFKPVQFDAIREYCNKNWQTDVNNYSSFANCYNSCSGRDTCRTKYKCGTARSTIESYCHSHYSDDGYNSYEVCVNDCICDDTKDYVYRPISLTDPFPKDRNPGSNWVGLEKIITNDSEDTTNTYTGKAEYVIELNKERIENIKTNTRNNGGIGKILLDYNGSYSEGFFHSKFINSTFKNYFSCINSQGSGCNQ